MRRFDKKQNILEANQRLEKSYLNSKGLIVETFNNVLTESSKLDPKKVAKVIHDAGGDPNSVETAGEFLNQLIDSDFDPSKIKVKDVIEKSDKEGDNQNESTEDDLISESGGHGGLSDLIGAAIQYMENTETGVQALEKLSKLLGPKFGNLTKDFILKALHAIEKVLNFVPKLLSRGIYKIIKYFGGGVELAQAGSKLGNIIWLIVLAVFAFTHWPGIAAFAATGAFLLKVGELLLWLWNMGRTIFGIVKNFFTGVKEVTGEHQTFIDLLTFFEKNFNTSFSGDVAQEAENIYNKMDDETKKSFSSAVKHIQRLYKEGRDIGEFWGELETRYKIPSDLLDKMADQLGNKNK